jgi:hypothetical protein
MSERLFRAVRDFVLVRLPHYLRVFAITLIFASPVLAALYFAPTLDHFSKAMYHIPSFALWALSAIIFYRLRKYLDYDRISRDPRGELHWQEELPRHVSILTGIAIVLIFIGGILSPRPL